MGRWLPVVIALLLLTGCGRSPVKNVAERDIEPVTAPKSATAPATTIAEPVATLPPTAPASDPVSDLASNRAPAREREDPRTAAALQKKVAWSFTDLPLSEFTSLVAREAHLPVELDEEMLRLLSISRRQPVSAQLQQVSLRQGLREVLGEVGLGFETRPGVIVITLPAARRDYPTRRYDVRRLLQAQQAYSERVESEAQAAAELQRLVTHLLWPIYWKKHPGPWLEAGDGALLVRQPEEMQQAIETLLNHLQDRLAAPAGEPFLATAPQTGQALSTHLPAQLNRQVSWRLYDVSLEDFAALVESEVECDVEVDQHQLQLAGLPVERIDISCELTEAPLDMALTLALGPQQLNWHYEQDHLVFTPAADVAGSPWPRVYDVRRLLNAPASPQEVIDQVGGHDARAKELLEAITWATGARRWRERGGPGRLACFGGLLLVNHSQGVHRQIEEMLKRLDAQLARPAPHAPVGTLAELQPAGTAPRGPVSPPQAEPSVAATENQRDESQEEGDLQSADRVWQALEQPIRWDFASTPLSDMAHVIREEQRIPVQLDHQALNDIGVPTDLRITGKLSGVSLASGLELLLGEHDIGYRVVDGALLLTSGDEMREDYVTEVHDLRPLLARAIPPAAGEPPDPHFADVVAELVLNTLAADSWEAQGGSGSLRIFREQMVVRQTATAQREIRQLIAGARQVIRGATRPPQEPLILGVEPGAGARLAAALRKPVEWSLADTTLPDLMERIEREFSLQVVVARDKLLDIGIFPEDLRFSGQFERLSLGRVLSLLLQEKELVWLEREGLLLITTATEDELAPQCRIYDVRRLLHSDDERPTDSPREDADYPQLCAMITGTVRPNSWSDQGGPGRLFPYRGLLVVSQSVVVHREIADVLRQLDAALNRPQPR